MEGNSISLNWTIKRQTDLHQQVLMTIQKVGVTERNGFRDMSESWESNFLQEGNKSDYAQPSEKLEITVQKSWAKIKELNKEKEKQESQCGWNTGNDGHVGSYILFSSTEKCLHLLIPSYNICWPLWRNHLEVTLWAY